jgi:hypothetical protein
MRINLSRTEPAPHRREASGAWALALVLGLVMDGALSPPARRAIHVLSPISRLFHRPDWRKKREIEYKFFLNFLSFIQLRYPPLGSHRMPPFTCFVIPLKNGIHGVRRSWIPAGAPE